MTLSGCVLHATPPIFDDSEAVLVLGKGPVTLAVFDREGGAWLPNDDPLVTAFAEGNHYLVPDPATPQNMTTADRFALIPLDASHYVIQATFKDGADYAIATWDGGELLVSNLDCDTLKTNPATNLLVQFQDDACSLAPSNRLAQDLFAILARAAPEPTLRLVVQ